MAQDFTKLLKVGQEIGFQGEDLKNFVIERQKEIKADKEIADKQKEAETQLKLAEINAKKEEASNKIKMAEIETLKLEKEIEANKLKLQHEADRLKSETADKIRLKELDMEAEKLKQEADKQRLTEEMALQKQKEELAIQKQKEEASERIRLKEIELESVKLAKEIEVSNQKFLTEMQQNSRTIELDAINKKLAEEYAADERKRNENIELKKLETQIKIKELEVSAAQENSTRVSNSNTEVNNTRMSGNTKDLKFPMFRENIDCLDAYLLRFERSCVANGVPERQWALSLARLLEGKSLEVYQNLDDDDSLNYSKLREALLKRFKLSESGYRQKFKQCVREADESVETYVVRLQRYLRQWLLMSGLEDSQAGLAELIIKDQFYVKSDEDMRRFLKEKGKLSLGEMVEHAQNYIEAREFEHKRFKPDNNKFTSKENRGSQKETEVKRVDTSGGFQNQNKSSGFSKDKQWFKNKWDFKNQKKDSKGTEQNYSGCFRCGSKNHSLRQCPEPAPTNRTQAIATMVTLDDEFIRGIQVLENSSVKHNKSIQPAMHNEEFSSEILVNNKPAICLWDTGASTNAIREEFVKPNLYTGEKQSCRMANGDKGVYPVAMIEIDGDEYKGKTKAIVIPNLVVDMIVGPNLYDKPKTKVVKKCCDVSMQTEASEIMPEDILSESSLLKDMKTEEVIAVCETRSHTEEVKHRLPKKLKFNKLPEVDVNPVELIKLQKNDPTLGKIWKLVESNANKQLTASEGKSIFVLKKGILYRQCKDKHKDEVKHQLVVPQKLRENVMSMAHESLLSAHQGVTRTLTKSMQNSS